MGKGIFERIASLISGERVESKESNPQAERSEQTGGSVIIEDAPLKDPLGDNSIEKIENLKEVIVEKISQSYRGQQHVNFSNKVLVVLVVDKLSFDLVKVADFKSQLISKVDEELGYKFTDIEIEFTPSAEKSSYSEVITNIYLSIRSLQESVESARITAMEDSGSMVKSQYILEKDEGVQYNIGSGETPRMPNGDYRRNEIAIDSSESSAQYHNNKFVSRSHAHISYSKEYGFMLYVENGGTRQMGKRTRIYRDGKYIDLTNPRLPEALEHNDILELSKSVRLLFEIVTE